MSGVRLPSAAKPGPATLRMESCLADPQQELLIVFREENLR